MSNTLAPQLTPTIGNATINSEAVDTSASARAMAGLIPTPSSKPATTNTTKSQKTPDQEGSKRRGPNSHRVRNMFDAITETRVPLDDVIKQHNVSVHVARQSKRFDPFSDRGQVMIKTLADDATGARKTYIWRMPNPSSQQS